MDGCWLKPDFVSLLEFAGKWGGGGGGKNNLCANGLDLETVRTRVTYYNNIYDTYNIMVTYTNVYRYVYTYLCVHTGSYTHLHFLALSAEKALEVMTFR